MGKEYEPAKPVQKLSVVVDAALVTTLQDRQRRLQQETGLRISMSQLAASLIAKGLTLSRTE